MKYLSILIFLALSINSFAQDDTSFPRNEVKINPISLLFEPTWVSVAYERVLNDESSVGANVTVIPTSGETGFGLAPYYRLFFGKKPAAGFFVEGAGLILGATGEDDLIYGASIAVGVKVLTKKNIVLDIFGGLGKWNINEFIVGSTYPRFGLNIGKRF